MSRCEIIERIYGDRIRRGCPMCPLFGIFISVFITSLGCSLLTASLEGFLAPTYNLPGILIVAIGINLTIVFLIITLVGECRYVRVLKREIGTDTVDNAPLPRFEEETTTPDISDTVETVSSYQSGSSESSNFATQEAVNEPQKDDPSPKDTNSSDSFMIIHENGTASGHNIALYGEGHGPLHDNEAGMIPVQHNIPLDIEEMEHAIPLDINAAELEQFIPVNQIETIPEHEIPLNGDANGIACE